MCVRYNNYTRGFIIITTRSLEFKRFFSLSPSLPYCRSLRSIYHIVGIIINLMSSTPEVADALFHVRRTGLTDESMIRLLEQLFDCPPQARSLEICMRERYEDICMILLKTLGNTHNKGTIGVLLRLFADLVRFSATMGKTLGLCSAVLVEEDPVHMFLYLATTHRSDKNISDPALYLAATALRSGDPKMNEESLERFFVLMSETLSVNPLQVESVSFAVHNCAIVAHSKALRHYFFDNKLVQYLPRLLTDAKGDDTATIVQLRYEVLVIVWLLSYEVEGIIALQKYKMIPQLHRIIQRMQKEKCIRVALMALSNFVRAERQFTGTMTMSSNTSWVSDEIFKLAQVNNGKGPSFVAEMVGVGMLKTLNQLSRHRFGDEDITEMVQELLNVLENSMETLTSFSEYRGEVLSGSLEWTPVHTCAKFWQSNIMLFEKNSYEVLEALGKIILNSNNNVTLAVACYDIGEVVRHHPTGRSLLQLPQLEGVLTRAMSLMSHEDPEVAKNALLAVQKIMVQRWECM
uniref:Putative ATP synthase n=1 Tax=Trypanosoma congolense (strain IL3000) TaxID=1068625 RepID=G0UV85_TRYCI|nr:putative ATP synthase [Trypanosoma congolense IL3000]